MNTKSSDGNGVDGHRLLVDLVTFSCRAGIIAVLGINSHDVIDVMDVVIAAIIKHTQAGLFLPLKVSLIVFMLLGSANAGRIGRKKPARALVSSCIILSAL